MKRIFLKTSALLCCVLCLVSVAARAQNAAPQNAPASSATLSQVLPRPERLEGTISVTSQGATTRARFLFQVPGNLRAEIIENAVANVSAQIYIADIDAAGNDFTQSVNSATGRVRQWNYSSVMQPWRSTFLVDGGPANIALFGWPAKIETAYAVSIIKGANNQNGATTYLLTARDAAGKRLATDFVRSGNSSNGAFYAASKRPVFNRPARIELQFADDGALLSRRDRDEAGRVITQTDFKWDATTRLPAEATTRDSKNRVIEIWKYELAPRATPFIEGTFELGKPAGEQIIEDAELRAISDYEKATDADNRFNLGAAQLRHTENIPAAFAAWGEAARLKPQAIAPHYAIFDAALRARDLTLADQALSRVASLRGATDYSVLSRRATLELRRRNWDAAAAALEAASRAQPQNLDVQLTAANLARSRGDFTRARGLLLGIVSSAAAQPQTQALAAETLASLVVGPASVAQESDAFLQTLPGDTIWQNLTRAHIELLLDRTPKNAAFSSAMALASLAQGQERAGQVEAALVSWQKIVADAPLVPGALLSTSTSSALAADNIALGILAREHLVALHAQRGEVTPSLGHYRELIAIAPDESARRRTQDMLLAAWKKSLHGDDLRPVLERRTQSQSATEDDTALWIAWQETFGTQPSLQAAIRNAIVRFPKSAIWHSRLAEFIADRASVMLASQDQERVDLTAEAVAEAEKAIKLDPAQPYYAMQSALIQIQHARRKLTVVDVAQAAADKQNAEAAIERLAQRFPDDADVAIALAVGHGALRIKADAASVDALEAALKRGTPERETAGSDRRATVFFVRQALASQLAKLGLATRAAQQYDLLMLAARDASEQAGIALQYLSLTDDATTANSTDTRLVARLMSTLAREPWTLEAAQGALTAYSRVLVTRGVKLDDLDRSPALQVSTVLSAANDPASIVAAAHLHFAIERGAKMLLNVQGAPPAADRLLRESSALALASEEALKAVATSSDAILAPRAAALLGERAGERNNFSETVQWLQRAVAAEPYSLDLRVGLARALAASGGREKAVGTRDEMLRALPRTSEVLRRAATMSRQVALPDDAARFAAQALSVAQSSRGIGVGTTEEMALLAARTLFEAGQESRATAIWSALINSTQWPQVTRLAALIDWDAHLRAATRTGEADRLRPQIEALQPTEDDIAAAQNYLGVLD